MDLTARFDAAQRRHSWLGFPLAVVYKFFDDYGSYLAALIAYYGFLSLFPLLLLLSSVLGFLLRGNPGLQERLLNSALSQFPVIGQQLGDPRGLGGSATGIAIGIAGSIYGGTGVAQATQYAMNVIWSVPRNRRPNPMVARVRSLLLLATLGVALLGTTVLTALGTSAGEYGAQLGPELKALVLAFSVALNAGVFLIGFRVATAKSLRLRDFAPGAIAAAIVWQVLQSLGATYVAHVVKYASATNSVFALVLGLIAWIYLEALTVVFCAEVNVVHAHRLYPRSLLSPFVEEVDLTGADRRAYTQYVKAERSKDVQRVDVSFSDPNPGQGAKQLKGNQRQDKSDRSS